MGKQMRNARLRVTVVNGGKGEAANLVKFIVNLGNVHQYALDKSRHHGLMTDIQVFIFTNPEGGGCCSACRSVRGGYKAVKIIVWKSMAMGLCGLIVSVDQSIWIQPEVLWGCDLPETIQVLDH